MPVKSVEFNAIDGRRLLPASQVFPNMQIVTNSTVTLISETGEREAAVSFRFDTNFRGLEKIVADDLWPLPKYSEILFIK